MCSVSSLYSMAYSLPHTMTLSWISCSISHCGIHLPSFVYTTITRLCSFKLQQSPLPQQSDISSTRRAKPISHRSSRKKLRRVDDAQQHWPRKGILLVQGRARRPPSQAPLAKDLTWQHTNITLLPTTQKR